MSSDDDIPPPPRRPANDLSGFNSSNVKVLGMKTPRRGQQENGGKDRKGGTKPRKALDGGETPGGGGGGGKGGAKAKYRGGKLTEVDPLSEEPKGEQYRDRAEERRKDLNIDYADTVGPEISTLSAVTPPGTTEILTGEAHRIAIENSKYLGGDVKHTHLVKGLDFALLQKVRREIGKAGEEEEGEAEQKAREKKEDSAMVFDSDAAKMVFRHLVRPRREEKVNEMFLAGRMMFVFDVEEEVASDIPTTVMRSKEDCPRQQDSVDVAVDAVVLDRIARIMAYLRLGTGGKVWKKKKKDRDGKPSIAGVLETGDVKVEQERPRLSNPEDDIFGGVGSDYAPELPKRDPKAAEGEGGGEKEEKEEKEEKVRRQRKERGGHKGKYFEQPSEVGEALPPPPPSAPPGPQLAEQWQGGYPEAASMVGPTMPSEGGWETYPPGFVHGYPEAAQEERDMDMDEVPLPPPGAPLPYEDVRGEGERGQNGASDLGHRDPTAVPASYSECYPDYGGFASAVVESDDEEDTTKMDLGAKMKGSMQRWDFDTEGEWESYNAQKEAMPKAAFQFGVKTKDGRRTRKGGKEEKDRDQKLERDLNAINKILERKKKEKGGGGDEYEDDEIEVGGKRRRV